MIWAVAIIEAGFIAVCVYQIRELTSRINTFVDMACQIIAFCKKINDQLQEAATMTKENGEAFVILNGKVSNNEHRIRDLYKAINQLKGWPNNEVEYRS